MVKVTFNSALAQKEAKKDEPKSSEEALIIPPDAVAVDCKGLKLTHKHFHRYQ